MKRTATAAGLVLAYALVAHAADFASLQPQGYISDFSGVIDPQTRTSLEAYCANLEAKTGAQIAVLTIPTLHGEPVEDVAVDIFRKWGVGQKTTNEGLLLLLVTGDRRMRIEVGYGLEPIIPDGAAGGILRSMAPALRESRYGDAVTEALRTIGERIATAKGVTLDGSLPQPRRSQRRSPPFNPISMVLGVIVLIWLLGALGGGGRGGGRGSGGSGRSLLAGMLIGNMLGRSMGGGRWGGGFGGFDSGGGFGGFGGGSSGGGGASGSW